MHRNHLVIAVVSAAIGLVALGAALASSSPVGLVGLLGVILLVNALIRYILARS